MPLPPDPWNAGPSRKVRTWLFSWRALLALALGGILAWIGARFYIQRRDRMLFTSAQRAVDSRDFGSAWFWLQRLYRERPEDIETQRLIARFEAAQQSPEELAWRVRVIRTGPATLDDYLAWASAALRLGQTGVALEALSHVPAQWQGNPGYQELLAGACLADGQLQTADDHFATAARMEPSNPVHLINLATVRLGSADEATRLSARATLEHQAASPEPLLAIRALLVNAMREHDGARTAQYRSAMRQQAGRSLNDELTCISAAPDTQTARAELTTLWDKAKADPSQALQVAEWMMRRGDSAEALAWLRTLPADDQSSIGIQMGEADALTATRDWAGLRAYLENKTWRNADFLRTALLARCARETHGATPAWADAITACRGDGSNMLLLAQTADGWAWKSESEDLYWRITRLGFPSRGPALKTLWDRYTQAGDSGGLLRVAREQYADAPTDVAVRNNYAFLSLLTGMTSGQPARIAEEDFKKQPESPVIAATYAYSLYLDGRYDDGLRVLAHFGPRQMQSAGAGLYLALLQRAKGDEAAASSTAAGVDATKLLPEERLLLQKVAPKASSSIERFAKNHV